MKNNINIMDVLTYSEMKFVLNEFGWDETYFMYMSLDSFCEREFLNKVRKHVSDELTDVLDKVNHLSEIEEKIDKINRSKNEK